MAVRLYALNLLSRVLLPYTRRPYSVDWEIQVQQFQLIFVVAYIRIEIGGQLVQRDKWPRRLFLPHWHRLLQLAVERILLTVLDFPDVRWSYCTLYSIRDSHVDSDPIDTTIKYIFVVICLHWVCVKLWYFVFISVLYTSPWIISLFLFYLLYFCHWRPGKQIKFWSKINVFF